MQPNAWHSQSFMHAADCRLPAKSLPSQVSCHVETLLGVPWNLWLQDWARQWPLLLLSGSAPWWCLVLTCPLASQEQAIRGTPTLAFQDPGAHPSWVPEQRQRAALGLIYFICNLG